MGELSGLLSFFVMTGGTADTMTALATRPGCLRHVADHLAPAGGVPEWAMTR